MTEDLLSDRNVRQISVITPVKIEGGGGWLAAPGIAPPWPALQINVLQINTLQGGSSLAR